MKKFDILGCGNVALSMVCNTIFKIYGKNVIVRIVKNIPTNDDTPFKIRGFRFEEFKYNEWKSSPSIEIIIGVMRVKNKMLVYDFFRKTHSIRFEKYSNLIHSDTSFAETVKLGQGIHSNAGVVVGPNARIDNLVTINRNVSIGHHTRISNFCSLNPGSNIAGFCDIGESVTIGMGANVMDGIKVGGNTVIGAGSLVTKDIPENVVAYGSPAKIIRDNKDENNI